MNLSRNIPLFIAFRVLFNARFYYPVLGILFLDLGLTLEQYALLNVVWAVSIVALDIPSGALADVLGRKRMVVIAASLMVAEMLIFAFAPAGRPNLLFALLILNRILSGASEASANGADEALAYESLAADDRSMVWPKVLERLMRYQSGVMFIVMTTGALIYDPSSVRHIVAFFGSTWHPTIHDTVRWPVYLTLLTAFGCLATAVAMREPGTHRVAGETPTVRRALQRIRDGARVVVTDRRILLIILTALTCDSIVRLFMTFESNYLRLIDIPAYLFGIIGSLLALLGFVVAPVARRMVSRHSPPVNFGAIIALILIGLTGSIFAIPYFGVWIIAPLGIAMYGLGFFVSHYLNMWTQPETRATVLSFRGVALNLAYGSAGLLFAALTKHIRTGNAALGENSIFANALLWLPLAFGIAIIGVGLFALCSVRKCRAENSSI